MPNILGNTTTWYSWLLYSTICVFTLQSSRSNFEFAAIMCFHIAFDKSLKHSINLSLNLVNESSFFHSFVISQVLIGLLISISSIWMTTSSLSKLVNLCICWISMSVVKMCLYNCHDSGGSCSNSSNCLWVSVSFHLDNQFNHLCLLSFHNFLKSYWILT